MPRSCASSASAIAYPRASLHRLILSTLFGFFKHAPALICLPLSRTTPAEVPRSIHREKESFAPGFAVEGATVPVVAFVESITSYPLEIDPNNASYYVSVNL